MTCKNRQKRPKRRDSLLSPVRLPVSPPGQVCSQQFTVFVLRPSISPVEKLVGTSKMSGFFSPSSVARSELMNTRCALGRGGGEALSKPCPRVALSPGRLLRPTEKGVFHKGRVVERGERAALLLPSAPWDTGWLSTCGPQGPAPPTPACQSPESQPTVSRVTACTLSHARSCLPAGAGICCPEASRC
jgi:hypothetical protein